MRRICNKTKQGNHIFDVGRGQQKGRAGEYHV